MSWELASFLLVVAVIVAGFVWYERSRPPAQVVALVAALAALAIAGRIAFAPFPNVKPTTDIVIFAGYALGGAPGFAVGALAALVSNFWFGQGPWTPWQMVGWGLCGVFGAALALGWRNAGRFTLAAACGLAGIAYGALLNFSLMATYGGELSWERYWLLIGRAIPFDVAHVVGNVAFALIAGPALVRMLTRFRLRFEWRREAPGTPPPAERPPGPRRGRPALRGGAAALCLALLLLLGALAPRGAEASEVSRAANWLQAQQNADGGFGASPGKDSGAEITAWAMLGLAAAGRNPHDVAKSGRSPVDYLRAHLDEVESPGDLARTIVALQAAGADPRDFGGENLVARLLAKRRANASYEGWPASTAFAVIALRGAGATGSLEGTLSWLQKTQGNDGGWGDEPGFPSTPDITGIVLQALSPESKAAEQALSFLRKAQRPGGGYALRTSLAPNTQSTSWAAQGIRAAGGDPSSFRRGGASPLDYIAKQQEADGHFRYSGSSDQTPIWVTSSGLVAASGKHYPIAPPARKAPARNSAPGSTGAASGGVSPSLPSLPPSSAPAPAPAPPASGSAGAGSGAGGGAAAPTLPETLPAPAGKSPGAAGVPEMPPQLGEGTGAAPEPLIPEAETDTETPPAAGEEDSKSPLGAVGLGLLAGGLLFAAAWAGRRGWMRWRYGL